MLVVRAEDNVLTVPLLHMLLKNTIQSIRLLRHPAQLVQIVLGCLLYRCACFACTAHIAFQILLTGIIGNDIFGRRQTAAYNGFAKRHLMRHTAVKQFVGHIALIIQIANAGRRQANEQRRRIHSQQLLYAFSPFFRAAAVELIQNDEIRFQFHQISFCHQHKARIGQEANILRDKAGNPLDVFQLRLKNMLAGRKPADLLLRIFLSQLESNKGFAGSGGVNHRRLAGFLQHGAQCIIGYLIVFKQFDQSFTPSFIA